MGQARRRSDSLAGRQSRHRHESDQASIESDRHRHEGDHAMAEAAIIEGDHAMAEAAIIEGDRHISDHISDRHEGDRQEEYKRDHECKHKAGAFYTKEKGKGNRRRIDLREREARPSRAEQSRSIQASQRNCSSNGGLSSSRFWFSFTQDQGRIKYASNMRRLHLAYDLYHPLGCMSLSLAPNCGINHNINQYIKSKK